MDIASLSTLDVAECTILHPATGLPTDIKIQIHGRDSRKAREVTKARAQAIVKARAAGSVIDDSSIEDEATILADLAVGWEGVALDGKDLPFTRENAIKVFTMSAPIRNQLDNFSSRTANFLPKP